MSSTYTDSKELIHGLLFVVHAYGVNGMGIQAIELFRRVPIDVLDD